MPLSYSCTQDFRDCRNGWLTDNLSLLFSRTTLVPCVFSKPHAVYSFRLYNLLSSRSASLSIWTMSALLPPNQTRGPSLLIFNWVTVSIASLLVVLRIYTRTFLRKTAGTDDWTMVVALVNWLTICLS